MEIRTVAPHALFELAKKKDGHLDLVDVRTPGEFGEVHVDFARNVPLATLKPEAIVQSRVGAGDDPIYIICHSGMRGTQACEMFHAAGYTNVVNVEGGTKACVAAGLPVVRGRKAVSVERQVRGLIGSMVVVGSALAYFVSPYWIVLPAFVGCGLIFAGVTDRCPIASVIAAMPWNQAGAAPQSATGAGPHAAITCCGGANGPTIVRRDAVNA